jgi:hypothetical protein
MATLLLVVLVVLTLAVVVEAIRDPARIYQYPFGAAAVFLAFIVPPLVGLLHASYLPRWGIERYTLMCILCFAMCWLGDACARRYGRPRARFVLYDSRKWLLGSAVLILLGGLAYLKSRALFRAEFDMSTGLPTAMSFFISLLRYGFVMALLHFLYTGNSYALFLSCLAGAYYLDRIIFFGRRLDTVELAFVVAGAVWFALGKRPLRLVVPAGIVIAALGMASTGAYRAVVVSTTGERDWSRLKEVNVFEEFHKATAEGSSETLSGIYLMAAGAACKAFDFGLYHWNGLIFDYFPAQVFGAGRKESLYFPVVGLIEMAQKEYGFTPSTGTTLTGMTDCYGSFWYLGCLEFFLIGYVMQWLYLRAAGGSMMAQAIYVFIMTQALHAVTHSTTWFVRPWVHVLFFWVPVMLYATAAQSEPAPAVQMPSSDVHGPDMRSGAMSTLA